MHNYKSLGILAVMFLMVGSLFCMNDILLPSLVKLFKLNYTQATFIQLTFYLTYIIFPIPIARFIARYGYKVGLVAAMVCCSLGGIVFLPAFQFQSYTLVLVSLFIISTGLTIVNVAANPFTTMLGDPKGAHARINFVQVFSRIGYSITPIVATILIYKKDASINFHSPYIAIAIGAALVALLIALSKVPAMKPEDNENFNVSAMFKQSKKIRHLFFGIIAMFFYVGAEACTAGFFIPYLQKVSHFTEQQAANYLSYYYIGASIVGLISVFILRFVKARKLVSVFGACMIGLFLCIIFLKTSYNAYFMVGLGLFLSIMFPTIFSLAIEGVGRFANKASAMLNFAIVGGSVFPPLQGMIADRWGINYSYIVPCICFICITIYALFFTKRDESIINQVV